MTGPNSRKISRVSGRAIVIRGDDIDTDRIIPARFLKEITFSNLGKYPFYDERFGADGSEKEHPFNDAANQGAALLFVNRNFGCGSSREHAPQSLLRWGIKALAGESFAEIFAGNCNTLGIPVLRVPKEQMLRIQNLAEADRDLVWEAELEPCRIVSASASMPATMPEHHRSALLDGIWDSTNLLLENEGLVRRIGEQLPYMSGYASKI